eukprot:351487-Chlamydomonas_euryale.AAC.9
MQQAFHHTQQPHAVTVTVAPAPAQRHDASDVFNPIPHTHATLYTPAVCPVRVASCRLPPAAPHAPSGAPPGPGTAAAPAGSASTPLALAPRTSRGAGGLSHAARAPATAAASCCCASPTSGFCSPSADHAYTAEFVPICGECGRQWAEGGRVRLTTAAHEQMGLCGRQYGEGAAENTLTRCWPGAH